MENMKKNFTEDQFQSPQIYFLGIQNRKQWKHKGKIIKKIEEKA